MFKASFYVFISKQDLVLSDLRTLKPVFCVHFTTRSDRYPTSSSLPHVPRPIFEPEFTRHSQYGICISRTSILSLPFNSFPSKSRALSKIYCESTYGFPCSLHSISPFAVGCFLSSEHFVVSTCSPSIGRLSTSLPPVCFGAGALQLSFRMQLINRSRVSNRRFCQNELGFVRVAPCDRHTETHLLFVFVPFVVLHPT